MLMLRKRRVELERVYISLFGLTQVQQVTVEINKEMFSLGYTAKEQNSSRIS